MGKTCVGNKGLIIIYSCSYLLHIFTICLCTNYKWDTCNINVYLTVVSLHFRHTVMEAPLAYQMITMQ